MYLSGPDRARIEFDRPLQTGVLDAAHWATHRSSKRWVTPTVTAQADYVEVAKTGDSMSMLSDRVIYDGTAGDLRGADGQAVASFAIYP